MECIRRIMTGVCLAFFLAADAWSGTTGILKGSVKDAATGKPLWGVNVILVGTQMGAVTDEDGSFRLVNVPARTYVVRFRMLGYRTVDCEKVVVRPDLETRLPDITMEPTVIEMEAVILLAEKPLIEKDVTGSVVTVSDQSLNRLPVTSFQDVLPMQAGVTREGNVRGGKATEVLYLIDGLPMQDAINGGVGVQLPSHAVQVMEIQTGGFDSEYGNALSGIVNVVTKGGSNDFEFFTLGETDDYPDMTQKDRLKRLEASIGGPIVKNHVFFFVSGYRFATDTRWWQDLKRAFDSPFSEEFGGFAKFDFQFKNMSRFTFQGLYSQKQWRDYEYSWRYNLDALPEREKNTAWAAFSWSHFLSKSTFLSLNAGYTSGMNRIGEGSKEDIDLTPYQYDFFLQYILDGSRSWWLRTRQKIGLVQGDVTSRINAFHWLKGGFQFQMYDIDGDIVKYEPQMTYFGKPLLSQPHLNYSTSYRYFPRSGNIYLQDKIEFKGESAVVSLGLRYDFLDPRAERPVVEWIPVSEDQYETQVRKTVKASFKGVLSPRIGMSMPLSDRSYLFANIGMYAQFPAFQYLYSGLDNVALRSGNSVLKGNPDLKPETNLVYEVSLKHTLPLNGVVTTTWFSKQISNQVDAKTYVPSNSRIAGDYGFAEYVNNEWAESRGIEISVARERGGWVTGSFSFTWMIAKGISSDPEQGIDYFQWGFPLGYNMYPLSWDQKVTLKASLHFSAPWGLDIGIYGEYHSPRPFTYYPSKDGYTPDYPDFPFVPNNERMSEYRMVDLKVSQTFTDFFFTRIILFADSRNLFNQRNVVWMDSSGRIGGELGDPGAYTVGRRTRIGIQLEF